jgi:hypothetical protein
MKQFNEQARIKIMSRTNRTKDITRILKSANLFKKNKTTLFNSDLLINSKATKISTLDSHGKRKKIYQTVVQINAENIHSIMPIMTKLYNNFGRNNTVIYGKPQGMRAMEQGDSTWRYTNFTGEEQLSPSTAQRIKEEELENSSHFGILDGN